MGYAAATAKKVDTCMYKSRAPRLLALAASALLSFLFYYLKVYRKASFSNIP